MGLNFEPETLEQLRARYPKALIDTYIQLDVARGLQDRPGQHRKHIFDFQDGVRLIISKEKEPLARGGRLIIHVSGSVPQNDDELPLKVIDDVIIHHIVEHFSLLHGKEIELEFKSISNETVAHFYLRLDN